MPKENDAAASDPSSPDMEECERERGAKGLPD